ncbi:energy transducer TonB family protein [Allomesorhizobium camelthorni]|uniref:TonB family protein n=1 Tax=Allomesorhizobium camelthorni TaxID=475069 RepID=A0A6G4WJD1_9HYPH|nr:energy transducer TonB [Mesorhizobium camelthorni]NGO54871.1 TonB family protein [Mesorhizobium camelthorni]
MSAPAELTMGGSPSAREAGRWAGAAVLVVAAHAAFVYLFHDLTALNPAPEAAEQALIVDLAPLPVSMPESVESEILPENEPVETIEPVQEPAEISEVEPEETAPMEPERLEEVQPEEVTQVEPEQVEPVEPEIVEQVQAEPQATRPEVAEPVDPEIVEEEIAAAITPEVVPLPEPRPVAEPEKRAETSRKDETNKPVRRKAEIAKPKPQREKAAERKVAKDMAKSKPSTASQKSRASRAPNVSPARWHNSVRAAIARRVGGLRGVEGTVNISFMVTASGRVRSARVSRSSGNSRLDNAAVRAVRSARVPAPPAELGGSTHSFSIPLTVR